MDISSACHFQQVGNIDLMLQLWHLQVCACVCDIICTWSLCVSVCLSVCLSVSFDIDFLFFFFFYTHYIFSIAFYQVLPQRVSILFPFFFTGRTTAKAVREKESSVCCPEAQTCECLYGLRMKNSISTIRVSWCLEPCQPHQGSYH